MNGSHGLTPKSRDDNDDIIKYLVERRTRELGLRMALGAAPYRLVRALVGEGLRLAATGVLIGVVGALGLTRLLSMLLLELLPRPVPERTQDVD